MGMTNQARRQKKTALWERGAFLGGWVVADEADIRILKLSEVNAYYPVHGKKKNRNLCEFHEREGAARILGLA
jgi:hypothetical protein